jgi:hypothetical protein
MLRIRRMDDTATPAFEDLLERLNDVNKKFVQIRAQLAETAAALENRALLARRQAEDFRQNEWAA